MNRQRVGRLVFVYLVVMSCLLLMPAGAWAQTLSTGSIAGVVKDASGGMLPGVTVEAASPALIEKVRTVATDSQGVYRIVDLRPGTYSVTFSLPGFGTVRREGLEVTASFTATVNAELAVGAFNETVTVSGESPVVDIQNATQQQVLARDTLDALPTGKNLGQYSALIPGAVLVSPTNQDVGGMQGEAANRFAIHGGKVDDMNLFQDGMLFNGMTGPGNTKFSFNRSAIEEVIINTAAMNAESPNSGVQVSMVPKEGGNTFSGSISADGANGSLQATNMTDALRNRGLTQANPSVKKLYDFSMALGGPVRRAKLWFFTAHRLWGTQQYQPGNYYNATQDSWFYTPDLSRPAYNNDYYRSSSLRLTWQASQKHKVAVYYARNRDCNCTYNLLTSNSAPEATPPHLYTPNYVAQGSWTYPVSNRLLFEAGAMLLVNVTNSSIEPEAAGKVAVVEQSTNYAYRSLAAARAYGIQKGNNSSQRFSMSYVTGSHAFKTGLFVQEAWRDWTQELIDSISYRFNNGVPNLITLWAMPTRDLARLLTVGLFAQDQWTLNKLTLNLGLRFDSVNGSVPVQHVPAGRFVGERNFAAVEHTPQFKDVNPRLGAAYDLFGNGKTAVKGHLGRYVAFESLNGLVTLNNPVQTITPTATRTWNDSTFGPGDPRTGNFVPDCDLLLPAVNGECGRLSDAAFGQTRNTTKYADDVMRGNRFHNWQGMVAVQHQLRPGTSLNVAYFRTWHSNFSVTDNLKVKPADYDEYCVTAPVDARLPGNVSGSRLCGLYDINPTVFGLSDNLVTQASRFGKQTEVYNGIDATINVRLGRGGLIGGGLSTGRTVTDNCFAVDSPQQARPGFCRVAPPWSAGTQVKFLVVYPLPWGFQSSATYQNIPGIPILASYVASSAQIAQSLGRPLAAGATANATIDLVSGSGAQYEDRIQQLDLRMTRIVRVGRFKLQGNFDVYNALNASPILSMITRYGPAWLQPTQILAGRLVKVGGQLTF